MRFLFEELEFSIIMLMSYVQIKLQDDLFLLFHKFLYNFKEFYFYRKKMQFYEKMLKKKTKKNIYFHTLYSLMFFERNKLKEKY